MFFIPSECGPRQKGRISIAKPLKNPKPPDVIHMDSIVNAALEEISVRGAGGIGIAELWRSLAAALSSAGLPSSDCTKNAIWNRLLSLPVLQFSADGCLISSQDPKIRSLGESERLGLRIIADEQLRDSFVGLDDLNAANAEISDKQRRTLERIAAARFGPFFFRGADLAKAFFWGLISRNSYFLFKGYAFVLDLNS